MHFSPPLEQDAKHVFETAAARLHGAESEVRGLRKMTERMILTQKEMVSISLYATEYVICLLEVHLLTYHHDRRTLFSNDAGLHVIGV